MRRQITDWEEISPKDTTDKEQLSKIKTLKPLQMPYSNLKSTSCHKINEMLIFSPSKKAIG